MYNDEILKESVCRECMHCVIRTIIPLFPKEWIPSFDEQYEENEEVIMEHEFCNELGMDLDHAVIECSIYTPKQKPNYFIKHLKVFDM